MEREMTEKPPLSTKPLIYIAAPYRHENPDVVKDRVYMINEYFAFLIEHGMHAVSPLLLHPVVTQRKLRTDAEYYWEEYGYNLMLHCQEVHILCLDGWQQSSGILGERLRANELNLRVSFIHFSHKTGAFYSEWSGLERNVA
jgi:hypothetical protein